MRDHADTLVVRTSFLFGPGRKTFIDQVLELGRSRRPVRAVLDWVNAPTFTEDLAEAVHLLVERGCRGIVNYTNAGGCSKFEFAREVLRISGGEASLIEPVRRSDLNLPAARPERTVLDLSRYTAIAGAPPRPWAKAMEAYLK